MMRLGKDHNFVLYGYRACSCYKEDDIIVPVLFLFTKKCSSYSQSKPGVECHDLNIPTMTQEEKADIDVKMDQILRAFSLDVDKPPGWKLIVANSLIHPGDSGLAFPYPQYRPA